MTDIDTVRLIIADTVLYDRAEAVGDGTSIEFPLPNVPVLDTTVTAWVAGVPTVPFAIDVRTGVVTFSAPPADGDDVVITYNWAMFLDQDIQTFLDLHAGSIRRAAAMALDTIASSEALIQKRMTILDLQTDGPAVADALRKHAAALRAEEELLALEDADSGLFDYAEMQLPVFSYLSSHGYKERAGG